MKIFKKILIVASVLLICVFPFLQNKNINKVSAENEINTTSYKLDYLVNNLVGLSNNDVITNVNDDVVAFMPDESEVISPYININSLGQLKVYFSTKSYTYKGGESPRLYEYNSVFPNKQITIDDEIYTCVFDNSGHIVKNSFYGFTYKIVFNGFSLYQPIYIKYNVGDTISTNITKIVRSSSNSKKLSYLDEMSLFNGANYNYNSYVFDNNNSIDIIFPVSKYAVGVVPICFYFDRTFYNENALNGDKFYEQGYNDGFSTGNQQGQITGYEKGSNDGYDKGYKVGYDKGYSKGLVTENDYTFIGLMTAIFEVPVNTLLNVLDFNFFGFNMKGLVVSCITLTIFLFIIRLIMSGSTGGGSNAKK